MTGGRDLLVLDDTAINIICGRANKQATMTQSKLVKLVHIPNSHSTAIAATGLSTRLDFRSLVVIYPYYISLRLRDNPLRIRNNTNLSFKILHAHIRTSLREI